MTLPNRWPRLLLAPLLTAAAAAWSSAHAADEAPTVLTSTQAAYSLTSALVAGTPIEVINVPADGRPLALQKDYIERRMERLSPTFEAATAVVSLTNALPSDPLYRFAREANIRIVDIEAAIPWSLSSPGVALAETPVSNVPWGADADAPESATAPYFWLSIANSIRMADLIAHDLEGLFPESKATLDRNLDALKRSLLALRNEYQQKLIEAGADVVFALTSDFVYLTNDLGLLVDGYFVKQDVRWTDSDLAALTKHLQERDIKVVLHKWQPSEAISAAIDKAGARLVVLDAADPGVVVDGKLARDGLQQVLRRDLEAIHTALVGD